MDDYAGTIRSPLSALPLCGAILILYSAIATQAEDSLPLSAPTEKVRANEGLELLKIEETVSIATHYEQPIAQVQSNVYVITDGEIRHSSAPDIPTVLQREPGLAVMHIIRRLRRQCLRGDNQLSANKIHRKHPWTTSSAGG